MKVSDSLYFKAAFDNIWMMIPVKIAKNLKKKNFFKSQKFLIYKTF